MSGEDISDTPQPDAGEERDGRGAVDRRQVASYRKFQNTALRALAKINSLLMGKLESNVTPVKVGELKGLVSAYREAAQSERAVLGLNTAETPARTGEMVVRWVDDDDPSSAGYGDA